MSLKCPICRTRPAWRRVFGHDVWICSECGAKLCFPMSVQLTLYALCLVSGFLANFGLGFYGFGMYLPLLPMIIATVLSILIKPIVEQHGSIHCNRCSYNLTGLKSNRRPECGKPIPSEP